MIPDPIAKLYEFLRLKGIDDLKNWAPPHHHYWASESGGCLRRVYYRLSGLKPLPETPEDMLLSMDGDVHHDIVRQLFDQAGIEQRAIVFEESGSVKETGQRKTYHFEGYDIEVSGRCDGEIATPRGWAVHEIKSIWFYGYKYYQDDYKKGGADAVLERIEKKNGAWVPQAQFMMDMRELDTWYLTLKDRNFGGIGFEREGRRVGVYLDRDPKVLDTALADLVTVEKALEGSTDPPPQRFLAGDWKCKSCRWRYACHDADARRDRGLVPDVVYPVLTTEGSGE
jgi:hypothetical protein